ncbi:MAG: precorrin-8X methylmutase [Thermodesulfovibrionales bacterium]|nr:precorrin-8X methylmutase [Thermodesulfovibrionales bacterium]
MYNNKDRILLIGHGSPKKEANNIEAIGNLLHKTIHPGCRGDCVKVAYLQFVEPDLMTALRDCINGGVERVIIHPFFLSSGMHVTKDIPELINEARNLYPDVKFYYSEPLGIHEKLVEIILDRVNSIDGLKGAEIEKRSFNIISKEDDFTGIPDEQLPIIKRVIHATADFEFKRTLIFHPEAIKTGIQAIRAGKDILTDVEMVRTGINKRLLSQWGGKVICNIQNLEDDEHTNKTRAERGIEEALRGENNIGIIAIGNAPTALLKAVEILNQNASAFSLKPILLIGVPVGFVNAVESKTLLSTQRFPFITNLSRKGGTPVAVAIVNALLKMAKEEK